jgi:hypothetical protein
VGPPILKTAFNLCGAVLPEIGLCLGGLSTVVRLALIFAALILLLQNSALADNAADRTAAKSHHGDYRSIFQKDRRHQRRLGDPRDPTSSDIFQDPGSRDQKHDDDKDASNTTSDSDKRKSDHSNNRPAGSDFNPSSFQDTDFSKHSFIDLHINSHPKPTDKSLSEDDKADQPLLADQYKRNLGDGVTLTEDKKRGKDKDKEDKHYDELMEVLKEPVLPGPNNWVPSKADPQDNGGFTIAPDNGSPVPYKLNGHVDLLRDTPGQ